MTTVPRNIYFKFRRLLDDLEYKFHHHSAGVTKKDGVYVRSDNMTIKMVYDLDFGWSIWADDDDDDNNNNTDSRNSSDIRNSGGSLLVGRVWDVPIKDQGDHPPEGVWVSRKGDKSYVYMLEYPKE